MMINGPSPPYTLTQRLMAYSVFTFEAKETTTLSLDDDCISSHRVSHVKVELELMVFLCGGFSIPSCQCKM